MRGEERREEGTANERRREDRGETGTYCLRELWTNCTTKVTMCALEVKCAAV